MSQPLLIAVGQGGISPAASFLTATTHSITSSKTNSPQTPHPLLPLFHSSSLSNPLMSFHDSEYKLRTLLPPTLPPHTVTTSHTGFGGNWTRGYYACEDYLKHSSGDERGRREKKEVKGGKVGWDKSVGERESVVEASAGSLLERSMDNIRTMVRQRPASTPFFVTHSLTGGTGSGFTSRMLTTLADEYPNRKIYTYSVTPFVNGEGRVTDSCGPVWCYNALLGLGYLDAFSDACIVKENCMVGEECGKVFGRVDMDGINGRIGEDFKSLLWGGGEVLQRIESDVVLPGLKYLSMNTSAGVSARVGSVGDCIDQQAKFCSGGVRRADYEGRDVRTARAVVVARGYKEWSEAERRGCYKVLNRGYRWDHRMCDFGDPAVDESCFNVVDGIGGRKEMSIVSLRSDVASFVRNVISKAWRLYEVKAYLRYFEELEEDDWREAFERGWGIVERYEGAFGL